MPRGRLAGKRQCGGLGTVAESEPNGVRIASDELWSFYDRKTKKIGNLSFD
jgi:hypothetical protein